MQVQYEVDVDVVPQMQVEAPAYSSGELPPGWAATTDEGGQLYYYNETTGETQWDPPVSAVGGVVTGYGEAADAEYSKSSTTQGQV